MSLAELLGLRRANNDAANFGVTVGKITLPMDIMIEVLIRQQSQLFSALNDVQGQIAIGEQVTTNMAEHYSHLHDDVLQLQQNLEGMSKHPVERVDEQTDRKERKPDEEKIH